MVKLDSAATTNSNLEVVGSTLERVDGQGPAECRIHQETTTPSAIWGSWGKQDWEKGGLGGSNPRQELNTQRRNNFRSSIILNLELDGGKAQRNGWQQCRNSFFHHLEIKVVFLLHSFPFPFCRRFSFLLSRLPNSFIYTTLETN